MTHSSGFGATDRVLELQQAGELNGLGEPKGLEVLVNHIASFVLFNVKSKTDPTDKGHAFSYSEAKAYILAQPDRG
ncbi:hypothetical protein [Antrihabitans cavernicola]|uniref:Uncharacterized protein n=1 Tax=Antrihabitans cavernicola TaxID=2495913 RepID=A0A5A7S6W1_9NOCA|nr:hypothetical protein [Spelaeibacter cavernicola]KAA0021616.1 hypothetical protein FOY51_17105 [Spelaeibacter cavernicola]